VYSLTDYYNSPMPLTGPTAISVHISNATALDCRGLFPYLSGQDSKEGVVMLAGLAEFSQLLAFCFPSSSILLVATAELKDLYEVPSLFSQYPADFDLFKGTRVQFRACAQGEFIESGECEVCSPMSYSLEPEVGASTQCKMCDTDGVKGCWGNEIELEGGYWRRLPKSHAVLACPKGANACASTNLTGEAVCNVVSTCTCTVCVYSPINPTIPTMY
jgi:hypothetical protein